MVTLYAPYEDRLLVAVGTPGEWTTRTQLAGHRLAAVAATADRAFVGTFERGLRRSADGETWEQVGPDAMPPAVTAVAVAPQDPEVVYAGTEPSRVYRSTDGGDTWTDLEGLTDLPSASEWSFPPRPDTHHVRWLEPDPTDADRLYVGVEAGALVYTTDGGATWHDRPPGSRRDNHSLSTHPDAPGRVYSAAGDGYAESTDGGETWTARMEGLGHRYCWSVAPDPGDPDRVYLTAAAGPRSAHSPGNADAHVYRRAGTEPWQEVDGLPTGEGVVRPVLAAPAPGTVYAASNRGLFRSTDGAETWTRLDLTFPDPLREQAPRGLAVVG